MSEKLETVNKIIIAASQISYMGVCIHNVNLQIKSIPDKNGIFKDGIQEREKFLTEVVKKLSVIMEDMGNFMNDTDCVTPIDTKIAKAPFDIIVYGQDGIKPLSDQNSMLEILRNEGEKRFGSKKY